MVSEIPESIIEFARQRGNLTKMFSMLKSYIHAQISPSELDVLTEYFRFKDVGLSRGVRLYHQKPDIYTMNHFTYHDWFTRDLRREVKEKLKAQAISAAMFAMPVECVIESIGLVGDMNSIIRLKKSTEFVNQELLREGIPPDYVFINMKLLTSHYHHVVAPCKGTIKQIMRVPKEKKIFGNASLTYIVISTGFGDVALMIVGEAVVQDFVLSITNNTVDMLDDIGYFAWGSQVVMLLPTAMREIIVKPRYYHFIGDTAVKI